MRFSNTYIAEPTCSPSRTALFTGMHERVNGVGFTSSYQLTQQQWERTYPALLRKAGYYTGFIGKFGVEYYAFRNRAAKEFDFWRGHDGRTRFFPKDSNTPSCTPYRDAEEDVITFIMGERAEEFFDSLPKDKPFCLSVSFNVPHGSQTTSMYPDYPDWHRMTRPANENPKLKGRPFYDTLYRDIDIRIPDATATDPYRFIPRFIMDQDKGRRTQTQPCRRPHGSNIAQRAAVFTTEVTNAVCQSAWVTSTHARNDWAWHVGIRRHCDRTASHHGPAPKSLDRSDVDVTPGTRPRTISLSSRLPPIPPQR